MCRFLLVSRQVWRLERVAKGEWQFSENHEVARADLKQFADPESLLQQGESLQLFQALAAS